MNQTKFHDELIPRYINQPKPGKKNWTVKDLQGRIWSVPPAEAKHFEEQVPIQVTYTLFNFPDGSGSLNMVESCQPLGNRVQAPHPVTTPQEPFNDEIPLPLEDPNANNQPMHLGEAQEPLTPSGPPVAASDNKAEFLGGPITANGVSIGMFGVLKSEIESGRAWSVEEKMKSFETSLAALKRVL